MTGVAGADEIDFGWWRKPAGYQARVSYQRSTACLYLHDAESARDVLLLACDEESARNLLEGWGDALGRWDWLMERLALAGVHLAR